MKKKGFTLIELLAVIVVLAVIAIIAVPQILNVIETARKGAAKGSALGYIDALEKKVAMSILKGEEFENGVFPFDKINLDVKGKAPTAGTYEISNGKIINATFCSEGYVVTYQDNEATTGEKCNAEDMKLNGSVKVSEASVTLTYPAEKTIIVTENISNGTLTCESSDTGVATCSIENNNIKIKSGTKEGQTTITVTSEGNSKYKEAKAAILVSTEEGLLTISANGYNGVYDGQPHGITITSSGSTIKYGLTNGVYDLDKNPTYTDVGTYTVYYQVIKEGYKPYPGSNTITITKANGSLTAPTAKSLTYTGSAQELVNAGSSTTGTVQYKLGSGEYSTSIPTSTDAGSYTVYYKVVGDNNHFDIEEASINVTIGKGENTLSISSNSGTVTYPGSTTFEVTNNVSGGTLTCASSNTNAATCSISGTTVTVQAGTEAADSVIITVTSAATSNYEAKNISYALINNLGTLSVTANDYTGPYDGQPHGITITSSGSTIKYGLTNGVYDLDENPTYTDVGTYTVYYQVTKEGYKPYPGSKTVTITKAEGSVVAPTPASNLKYAGSAVTLINPGSSTTGTIQYKLNSNGTYSENLPTASAAGTYNVYYKVVGDNNHENVDETYITVTVTNATYTVTLDRQSGTTGSTSVTATYNSGMPSATMPTRSGYAFGGYFTGTNGSGTQYYNANGTSARTYTLTSGTTLYAKWTACGAGTYVNGTTCSACPAGTYSTGSANASCTSCPSGYGTGGATGRTAQNQCYITCSANTIVATANAACTSCGTGYNIAQHNVNAGSTSSCAANTYTVVYNGNGATGGSTANSSHTYGTAQALTSNGFTRSGYTFLGWSTSSTATTATYSNGQSVSNLTSTNGGTVNLYAVWKVAGCYKLGSNGWEGYYEDGTLKKCYYTNLNSGGSGYRYNGYVNGTGLECTTGRLGDTLFPCKSSANGSYSNMISYCSNLSSGSAYGGGLSSTGSCP